MKKSNMKDHDEFCLFEDKAKKRLDIALKMFKDGVTYKIIERYTGIDVQLHTNCFETAIISY
jgi:uncharacterized protein YerC